MIQAALSGLDSNVAWVIVVALPRESLSICIVASSCFARAVGIKKQIHFEWNLPRPARGRTHHVVLPNEVVVEER
jgi:hypothetical protein